MTTEPTLPSVGVVVPTRDRPELVRLTLKAIAEQDYAGRIEVVVVHDQVPPDHQLVSCGHRPVRVCGNLRSPGLAGARNTGIMSLETYLVAFCDDDDLWLPGKISTQVARLMREPDAELCTCAIVVRYDGHSTERLAHAEQVDHQDLVRSRMSMLHSSTFVLRLSALRDDIGLLDESIPGSQNEDWELLLRASRRRPIAHVDEPLVAVRWGGSSFFARQWRSRIDSLVWLLERYPELGMDPVGNARVSGQIGFGLACLGQRREAMRWALKAFRQNHREWRSAATLTVACGIVSGDRLLAVLHRFGRGV